MLNLRSYANRKNLILAFIVAAQTFTATIQAKESDDRLVDEVAYQAQSRAQVQLQQRIQKLPLKSESRADYMVHLTDLMKEKTALSFRLQSFKNKFKPMYQQDLELLIKSATETTAVLKDEDPDQDRMVFALGSAWDEKGDKKKARTIYLSFLERFKESNHRNSVIMAYTAQLVTDNKHAEAIKYLEEIHTQNKSAYWSFAMHRMAWSQFNLTHYRVAMDLMGELLKGPATVVSESACLDQATFGAEAIEKKTDNLTVGEVIGKLKSSCLNADNYRRSKLRLAKIFRSHELADSLAAAIELDRKEQDWNSFADLVALSAESAFEKRNWSIWQEMLKDVIFAAKMKPNSTLGAQLAGQVKTLTEVVNKNKKSSEITPVLGALKAASSALADVTIEAKERAKVYWNMGEVYFMLENFAAATENYTESEKLNFSDEVHLRKIASTYEMTLRSQKWTGLKARTFVGNETLSKNLSDLRLWTKEKIQATSSIDFINFYFGSLEMANEVSPAIVQIDEALGVLMQKSALIPQEQRNRISSWITDSYLMNSEWKKLIAFVDMVQKNKKVVTSEVLEKLGSASLQSQAKLIEIARKNAPPESASGWISMANNFVEKNPNRKEALPVQLWLVEAGVKSGDAQGILGRLDAIALQYGDEALGTSEWELKYALSEKSGDAMGMWNALESLVQKDEAKWKDWTVFVAFAYGYTPKKCFSDVCARLNRLRGSTSGSEKHIHSASLAFHKRPAEFKKWVKAWGAMTPLEQQTVSFHKQELAKKWLDGMRSDLRKLVSIKNLSERSLIHRLEWIAEIEKSSKALAALPSLMARRDALQSMRAVYADFETDVQEALKNSSAPAELAQVVGSIHQKGQEFDAAIVTLNDQLNKQAAEFTVQSAKFSPSLTNLSKELDLEIPSNIARFLVQLKLEKQTQVSLEGWAQWKSQQKSARRLVHEESKH